MTDTSSINEGDVFGGAARAGDYIEEETVSPQLLRQSRAVHSPPTTGPTSTIPTMPESPAMPVRRAEVIDLAAPVPARPTSKPIERTRDESLSVLFGGAASGLTPGADVPARSTKGIRGLLRLAPSAVEIAEHQRQARVLANDTIIRQATWTRHVRVLVANKKGGVGKTPLSILLGGVIASIRGGSVAIWEVCDDPGALNFRAEGHPSIGLGELVRDVDSITSAGALAGYTVPQTSFASVIGTVGARSPLTADDVVRVSDKIGEFYGIEVMDSGNVPTSPAFQGAVSVADVLVIPVMNSGDSVLQAIEVLDVLRRGDAHAHALAATAIVVLLKDGRPENPVVVEEVQRLLHSAGIAQLHDVPYDTHIAERGQLSVGALAPATRDALAAAAAGVVRSLQSTVSTVH